MAESLAGVDLIGLEFNHDVEMQKSSRRPEYLIERNLGDRGHLSNAQAALLLEAVLSRSHEGAPRHVVLLHLSEQCNQPELALEAARAAIADFRAGSPGAPRAANAGLAQHLAERRPRPGTRLRTISRSTAGARASGNVPLRNAALPVRRVSCPWKETRTRKVSPRRSSERGALFRQRRPPAIRSTRSRPAIQRLAQPVDAAPMSS